MCMSSSNFGAYESHKTNSGLGQKKFQRCLSPVNNNQHNSTYKEGNWTHNSSKFLVVGTFLSLGLRGTGCVSNHVSLEIIKLLVSENFLLPLHRASGKFPIYDFLRNGPIKEFLKVQTSFLKSTLKQFDSIQCT